MRLIKDYFWLAYATGFAVFMAIALIGTLANHTITVRAIDQSCIAPAVVRHGALSANPFESAP